MGRTSDSGWRRSLVRHLCSGYTRKIGWGGFFGTERTSSVELGFRWKGQKSLSQCRSRLAGGILTLQRVRPIPMRRVTSKGKAGFGLGTYRSTSVLPGVSSPSSSLTPWMTAAS